MMLPSQVLTLRAVILLIVHRACLLTSIPFFFVLLFAQSDVVSFELEEQLTREAIAITDRKLRIVDARCWSQKPRVRMNKFRSSIPDGAIFRAKVL